MLGDIVYRNTSMSVAKCLLQQPDKKDDQ
jgi:hypothetical protein